MRTFRACVPGDDLYLDHLQHTFTEQLGYLPRMALRQLISRRTCWLSLHGRQEVGAFVIRPAVFPSPAIWRILQAAVPLGAQRDRWALQLLAMVEESAIASGIALLTADCRQTLPAMLFWRAAGFFPAMIRPGGVKRHTPIVRLCKLLRPIDPGELLSARPDPRRCFSQWRPA